MAEGLYLLVLSGLGEFEAKVVDAETWNWIFGPSGQPHSTDTSWEDPFVPARQRKLIEEDCRFVLGDTLDEPDEGLSGCIRITSGSYENDRALFAVPAEGHEAYSSIEEMREAVAAAGDTILEEWHGVIY